MQPTLGAALRQLEAPKETGLEEALLEGKAANLVGQKRDGVQQSG